MGLLLPPPASLPAWHPATKALYAAMWALGSETEQVVAVAVAWSVHPVAAAEPDAGRTHIVVGMSNLRELHKTVAAWQWANNQVEGRRFLTKYNFL